uniref:DNA2/NAM7 helicase-like C-terminal domain-containing protein n=1 Tax=Ramularia collo-cygni TaxID=112498 RepID=A0A2D3US00_9PEZI
MIAQAVGNWTSRIVSTAIYGDPEQLGPVVMGVFKTFNSDHPGMNEFGAQLRTSLMERLQMADFPSILLQEQSRMSSVLWEPANKIFYEEKIKSKTDKTFPLPVWWNDMVRTIPGHEKEVVLTPQQEWLTWVNVPLDSMRQTASGSKGNYAAFYTIMSLIKGTTLHDKFGEDVEKEVSLLVPYKRQLRMYTSAFTQLRTQG